jgi:UDP-N-acetylglucosamine 2-epimerase (non-hydrolysing)
MKVVLVAGARPNFMKIASIVDAIHTHNQSSERRIDPLLVHTGQHYDRQMSGAFFADLALPQPDVDLEVGSGSHAQQTAQIMKRFEPVILQEQPDVVLVVGDVNSTIACALVATKVVYPGNARRSRPLVAHVEAGLRSCDRTMPEEVNRILTDALSDFLFTSEASAKHNLLREGIAEDKIFFVGNTMVDTLLRHKKKAQESSVLSRLGLETNPSQNQLAAVSGSERLHCRDYAVVTLHRPSNVDTRETLEEIFEALAIVAQHLPIVFPVHPRTIARIKAFGLERFCEFIGPHVLLTQHDTRIHCLEPLGYLDFLRLTSQARLVLTDSGGLQEEATVLGIPCVTLRHNTERPATLTQGTNVLAGTKKADIIHHALNKLCEPVSPKQPELWDGKAGQRIVKILSEYSDERY